MSRRQVVLSLTGVILGLAIALAVPADERALALFAYLLLLGGTASTVLVRRAWRANPAVPEVFWQPRSAQPQRVRQLEEITRELQTVLELASDPRGELAARLRIVAGARLLDRRGIELDRQPEQARAAIDDELAWRLVREGEHAELPALGTVELSRILASLERI